MRTHVLLGVAIAAGATTARAQPASNATQSISPSDRNGPAPQPTAKPPSEVCLIGRALPYCASIMLAEMSVSLRDDGVWSADLEGGLLVNQGRHNAWGLSLGLVDTAPPLLRPVTSNATVTGQYKFMVVHGRYRRWLTDWRAVDSSVGGGRFGLDGQAAIEIGDAIAIVVGGSTVPDPTGGKQGATIGVRLGAPALLLLLAVITGSKDGPIL
jgi:hypothetical protein